MGLAYDITGSYQMPLAVLIGLPLIAVVAMTRFGPYPEFDERSA